MATTEADEANSSLKRRREAHSGRGLLTRHREFAEAGVIDKGKSAELTPISHPASRFTSALHLASGRRPGLSNRLLSLVLMDQAPTPAFYDQPRFALIDEAVETPNAPKSPGSAAQEPRPLPPSSSPAPLPSTEAPDQAPPAAAAAHPPKKKGTAAAVKKGPKRTRNGDSSRKTKKSKSGPRARGGDDASGDDESDNGPYCLCRGPDDHRWMICCENCEDWFHGECININKEIGEALIERFVCPLCTKGNLATIYKKTCALSACRKPARLRHPQPSVFCSSEHAQTWWERMVARLPKSQPGAGPRHQHLAQDELMAILNSGLGAVGDDGTWKVARPPFSGALPEGAGDEGTGEPATT